MAMKAKHAFGSLSDVQKALDSGKIDSFDILFLDGDTNPKIGWIDAKGEFRLVQNETDFSELETIIAKKADAEEVEAKLAEKADAAEVEAAIATKADAEKVKAMEDEIATKISAEEVDVKVESAVADSVNEAKIYTDGKIEAAIAEHLTQKYEIADAPVGTLVKISENEIRICCPHNAEYHLQNVGVGGDSNTYYVTFKTYVYDDNAVGYKEHLGGSVDAEVLTDFKTDEYGRRYQPTWLGVAKYDEATDTWSYYGANSNENKMIGWDYQLDLFDANGVMIDSDSIRINLSNENCHSIIEPYYVGKMMKKVETIVDEKIKEVESSYEVIEF